MLQDKPLLCQAVPYQRNPVRHTRIRRAFSLFLAFFLTLSIPYAAWPLQSQMVNLADMAKQADRILAGRILSVREGSILGGGGSIPVMEYTLSVSQVLKGQAAPQIVIRHFRVSGGTFLLGNGSMGRIELPIYRTNEDLILFLTADSSLGLSSPVGLIQGVFQIKKDKQGLPASVANALNNAGLLKGIKSNQTHRLRSMPSGQGDLLTPLSTKEGPISYESFIAVVTEMAKM